jgi:8-hydroxy-5-deazaflavin:NADPH oxidoreductase
MRESLTQSGRIKTISMVGAGRMAEALSRRAVNAGLNVSVSNSRDSQASRGWVDELPAVVHAASPRDAADAGDIVVLAVPFGSFEQIPADVADGKVLLDLTNYYPGHYAPQPLLDESVLTSSALIQRHFAGAHVVKAFNTIASHHITNLARPHDASDRTAIPVAADKQDRHDVATELLDLLGFDALAVGTLADSWRIEPGTPAFVEPYLSRPGVHFTQDAGRPMPAEQLAVFVDAARR